MAPAGAAALLTSQHGLRGMHSVVQAGPGAAQLILTVLLVRPSYTQPDLQSPSTAPAPLPAAERHAPSPSRSACTPPSMLPQFIYFAGFVGTVIACWVLRDYGGNALDFSPLNEARPRAAVVQGQPVKRRRCCGDTAVCALGHSHSPHAPATVAAVPFTNRPAQSVLPGPTGRHGYQVQGC